ncbi:MAG TPA: DEAD/DEAH box helicase [Candidatus Bathyarchaeia archaeon]
MEDFPQDDFPFVYKPMKHQVEEWAHRDTLARGLLWDPGTGKSKSAIDKMAYLWLTGKIDTVIVMAKKGEYTNWKYVEIPEHMPPEVDYVCEVYRSGLKEHEKQNIRNLVKPSNKLRILNINAESMIHEGGQVARAFAKTRKLGLFFILDESTLAKSHKSARAKEVYRLAHLARYRMIMTGTFSPNSPLDVWGQSKVLGEGIMGTTSFYSFKSEYCVEEIKYFGERHFKQITGAKNLDRLNKKIRAFASIKERHECFDLPPKIYKKVVVPLSDEQEQMYSDMRDMAFAQFGDNTIVEAASAMEIISKMDQIAVGQLKLDDGSYRILKNHRVEAVMTQLEDSSAKGIIWCNYRGMLEHMFEELRKNYGVAKVARFYGGVKDDEREAAVRSFQDPGGDVRWIVANQQSLGYGRTLTTGKENHYLSNGYNLEHRLQSEDRTMRLGQVDSVLYLDYYARGTVNEKIFASLRAKKSVMAEILGTSILSWI